MWGGEKWACCGTRVGGQLSPSTMWVLGTQLKLSGLVGHTRTHWITLLAPFTSLFNKCSIFTLKRIHCLILQSNWCPVFSLITQYINHMSMVTLLNLVTLRETQDTVKNTSGGVCENIPRVRGSSYVLVLTPSCYSLLPDHREVNNSGFCMFLS